MRPKVKWSKAPSAWNATDHWNWSHPSHHSNPLSLPHASCRKAKWKTRKGNYQKQRVWLTKVQPQVNFQEHLSPLKKQHLETSVPKQTSLCFSFTLLLLLRFLETSWLKDSITTLTPAKVPKKAQLAPKEETHHCTQWHGGHGRLHNLVNNPRFHHKTISFHKPQRLSWADYLFTCIVPHAWVDSCKSNSKTDELKLYESICSQFKSKKHPNPKP